MWKGIVYGNNLKFVEYGFLGLWKGGRDFFYRSFVIGSDRRKGDIVLVIFELGVFC